VPVTVLEPSDVLVRMHKDLFSDIRPDTSGWVQSDLRIMPGHSFVIGDLSIDIYHRRLTIMVWIRAVWLETATPQFKK